MSTNADGLGSQSASFFPFNRAPIPESYISRPVRFDDGPYARKHIMVRLAEMQKADVGRKCGLRDRRPLDPPPVARLRLYEVRDPGVEIFRGEEITDLAEVDSHGWMCHVDLFPVPLSAGSPLSLQHPESSSLHGVPDYPVSDQSRPQYTFPPPSPPRTTGDKIFPGLSSKGTVRFGHESTYSNGVTSPAIYGTGLPSPVATYYNGIPILESSACTAFIVGTTVASSTVLKYEGTKQIIFTFSDIAVREDGDYFLRYRVFNTMHHVLGDTPIPILAECSGGPFKVYSTKDFPGLRASTDLTKQISLSGTRVNARERERKRRRSFHTGWHYEEMQSTLFVPGPPAPQAGTSASTSVARTDMHHYYTDEYHWPGRGPDNYAEWRRAKGGSF
ncbi:velvet factor-domain-containing protein [Fomitopsis betulina]|nr:velvet factor-domain-containing protein [Fomitopsis betulina]